MRFRVSNEKSTRKIFMSAPPAPMIGPVSCRAHIFYFIFVKRARAREMGNARGMKPVRLSGRLCAPRGHEKYGIIALARNRQAPGCVRIRVRWVSPPARPLPLQRPAPLRATSFARTRPQRSRLPIPPKAVRAGLHFSQLSAASPGHAFAPLSATGLGF